MLFLHLALLCTTASPALAYSKAAIAQLSQLSTTVLQSNTYINHLEGCGYTNTTEAITSHAAITAGSACPSADSAIAANLTSLIQDINSTIAVLHSSRQDTASTSSEVVNAFTTFSNAYYTLFNALDLAECTYILTPASQSFAAQFGPGALKDSFNALVAELSSSAAIALQVAGLDVKQQTHFVGTSFLATQVGGPGALVGCEVITGIVTSEGGGSS